MQGTWCQSSPFTTTSQAGFLETLLPVATPHVSDLSELCRHFLQCPHPPGPFPGELQWPVPWGRSQDLLALGRNAVYRGRGASGLSPLLPPPASRAAVVSHETAGKSQSLMVERGPSARGPGRFGATAGSVTLVRPRVLGGRRPDVCQPVTQGHQQ